MLALRLLKKRELLVALMPQQAMGFPMGFLVVFGHLSRGAVVLVLVGLEDPRAQLDDLFLRGIVGPRAI
jgi:hypothetical protein